MAGPGGAEVRISFLPNNEFFVTVPPGLKLLDTCPNEANSIQEPPPKRLKIGTEHRGTELGSLPCELHSLISCWLPLRLC